MTKEEFLEQYDFPMTCDFDNDTVIDVLYKKRSCNTEKNRIVYINSAGFLRIEDYDVNENDNRFAYLNGIAYRSIDKYRSRYILDCRGTIKQYFWKHVDFGINSFCYDNRNHPAYFIFKDFYNTTMNTKFFDKFINKLERGMTIDNMMGILRDMRNEVLFERIHDRNKVMFNITPQEIAEAYGSPFTTSDGKTYRPDKYDVFKVVCNPRINIGRDVENENEKTFDYISVEIPMVSYIKDKKGFIKKHSKEMLAYIKEALENDRYYSDYGVPFEFLKLTRIIITKSDLVIFFFDLKKLDSKTP